ncbi:MAG: PEP-CTERM sorting domain-containing protein [Gammaproteobacteria bacterium]|nr:PEP-CTERM sorting domain-containing protein [Gammaproteobacteria bacterium]
MTLQIDELVGGYAALDNFRIAASDTSGDVGNPVPEPVSCGLLGLGLAACAAARRRRSR